jgi:hypothetical protein
MVFKIEQWNKYYQYCCFLLESEQKAVETLKLTAKKYAKLKLNTTQDEETIFFYKLLRKEVLGTIHQVNSENQKETSSRFKSLSDLENYLEELEQENNFKQSSSIWSTNIKDILFFWSIEDRSLRQICYQFSLHKSEVLSYFNRWRLSE